MLSGEKVWRSPCQVCYSAFLFICSTLFNRYAHTRDGITGYALADGDIQGYINATRELVQNSEKYVPSLFFVIVKLAH
jgi:hypothetical protein